MQRMRIPTATGQEPISAITYPARPVNGGPLDIARVSADLAES